MYDRNISENIYNLIDNIKDLTDYVKYLQERITKLEDFAMAEARESSIDVKKEFISRIDKLLENTIGDNNDR